MLYRSIYPPVKVFVREEISKTPKFHNYGNFDHIHIHCYGEVARSSLHDSFMSSTQIISEYNHT
jgi:hypothetical protein